MAISSLVAFALVAVCVSSAAVLQNGGANDNSWDYMLFVHRWPPSVCVEGSVQTGKVQCVIPTNLSPQDWVMHGVWPTKAGTEGPVNCDPKLPWDPSTVNPLLKDLNKYWPNLEANTPYDSFWKHEYVKHGSCALNFPPLVGETNFFTKPLALRDQYKLYQGLASQNIAPSDGNTFTHDQVINALQKVYGKRAEVWCGYEKETKKHFIEEIRFCLDKTFTMQDCPNEDRPTTRGATETSKCPRNIGLNYPPLKTSSHVPRIHLAAKMSQRKAFLSRIIAL